jgi:hypothetical protein
MKGGMIGVVPVASGEGDVGRMEAGRGEGGRVGEGEEGVEGGEGEGVTFGPVSDILAWEGEGEATKVVESKKRVVPFWCSGTYGKSIRSSAATEYLFESARCGTRSGVRFMVQILISIISMSSMRRGKEV